MCASAFLRMNLRIVQGWLGISDKNTFSSIFSVICKLFSLIWFANFSDPTTLLCENIKRLLQEDVTGYWYHKDKVFVAQINTHIVLVNVLFIYFFSIFWRIWWGQSLSLFSVKMPLLCFSASFPSSQTVCGSHELDNVGLR